MLEVVELQSYYRAAQALFGVNLTIGEAEVVTLLGRNGMGKSTTIRSIMGLVEVRSGTINFHGEQITGKPPFVIARKGIGLVPEGRQIFPNLTVRENLLVAAANHTRSSTPYSVDDILTIFPRLAERLSNFGNQLSGGEQQMLAVGRALMINPRLLILDEATEGLAPLVRKEIWHGLNILKGKGLAILIVDKNLKPLMEIADHHYILENGAVVWEGLTAELEAAPEIRSRYLGV
jgi:branched-chain amino acid transport system ATP-binding protein